MPPIIHSPVLDYAPAIDLITRRWAVAVSVLSIGVGLAGAIDGVPRVVRAWGYVFDPGASRLMFPLHPGVAYAYLPVSVVCAALSIFLIVAGLVLMRNRGVGSKLHSIYATLMLPVAIVLAALIAMIFSGDPVAGPLSFVEFVIQAVWFAAYPAFVVYFLRTQVSRSRRFGAVGWR